jgi:hypothetical protein
VSPLVLAGGPVKSCFRTDGLTARQQVLGHRSPRLSNGAGTTGTKAGATGASNKGLQLTRALGAGAYSLVGWAASGALVKVGPSQLKPSVVRAMVGGEHLILG